MNIVSGILVVLRHLADLGRDGVIDLNLFKRNFHLQWVGLRQNHRFVFFVVDSMDTAHLYCMSHLLAAMLLIVH